jgi:hypothetical protein
MATVPTVAELRAWLKVTTAAMSDAELTDVLAAEVELQVMSCRVPDTWPTDTAAYPPPLRLALFRRCGRSVAARGVPLGLTGSEEYGPARLPSFDPEIERLERRLRKFVTA